MLTLYAMRLSVTPVTLLLNPQITPLLVPLAEIDCVGPRVPNTKLVCCSTVGTNVPGGTVPEAKPATLNLRPGSPDTATKNLPLKYAGVP